MAFGTASKWHIFTFLEAETPYPTPEYHWTWLEQAGGRAQGPLEADGSRWEDHDNPIITSDDRKGVA